MDIILKNDIEEEFRGKLWAYTPVATQHGIGLGVAVANESGYSPVPLFKYIAMTWDEASDKADDLNEERGINLDASLDIVTSSVAQGKVN